MKHNHLYILSFLLCFKISISQTKVAIIGGGIAGVSSAHYIHQFDSTAKITIYEKEKILGGNAKTVEVLNAKLQSVKVDIGPQYFVEGPWDNYIHFLNEVLGKNAFQFETLTGSLLIQNKDEQKPHFITPLGIKLRGEKLKNLLKFKRFNNLAFDMYKHQEKWKGVSIETWYNQIQLPDDYKKRIIYPFLAASLGTSVSDIKTTSAVDIVKLFAFRKPKASNKFKIMTDGMGTLILQIGKKLNENGVEIKTEAPVYKLSKQGNKWLIEYKQNNIIKSDTADFVASTIHANQNINLIKDEPILKNAVLQLQQLKYFEAKIVLHNDSSFVNINKPAFLNILTNNENEIVSSTMNLSMISGRLNGIYKSWLSQNDIEKLKSNHKILHQTTFYHPLITPDFIKHLESLHQCIDNISNLHIGGGWSEGLETQNSAVNSSKRALEKYKSFKLRN